IASSPLTSAPTEATTLQRLANGQIGTEGPEESGLARLSRMLQERQSPQQNPDYFASSNYSYQPPEQQRTEEPSFPIPNNAPGSPATSPMNYAPPVTTRPATPENTAPTNYAASPANRPAQAPEQTTISAQPLRASPIQD